MTTDDFKVPLADFPGFNLRAAANAAMSRLSEILGAFDLRITEASILVVVQANPGCKQNQIGNALNMASANLTPTLHKLENRGLITRSPLDGRTNALELTESGQVTAASCLKSMKDFEALLVQQIRPLGETDLNNALKQITAALSNQG